MVSSTLRRLHLLGGFEGALVFAGAGAIIGGALAYASAFAFEFSFAGC
jgi:hypothetical protein